MYKRYIKLLKLKKDDTLLVSSNILPFAYYSGLELGRAFNPTAFIDDLQSTIPEGTLLFPVFNYGFCEGATFDYKNTPPQNMGTLSNAAFNRPDFSRTKHPVFSFMVWGKLKEEFLALNNSDAFGLDSPFALLYDMNAKNLLIDIPYNESFTFAHFVEEQERAPYRYTKSFTSDYIDEHGNKNRRTITLYVRRLEDGVENNINPTGKIMEGCNAVKIINPLLESTWKLIDLRQAYDIIAEQIHFNPDNIRTIKK